MDKLILTHLIKKCKVCIQETHFFIFDVSFATTEVKRRHGVETPPPDPLDRYSTINWCLTPQEKTPGFQFKKKKEPTM